MAEWSRDKVDSTQLNNGNEFDNNSDLALDEINAVVNSGLYSQDFAEHLADTPDTSEAGNIGTPTVSLVDNIIGNKTFKKFKFSNLKGTKGDKGEQGEQGPQGPQGEQGVSGRPAIFLLEPIIKTYAPQINTTYSFSSVFDFNIPNNPIVNEYFTGMWQDTSSEPDSFYTITAQWLSATQPYQIKIISRALIQGNTGPINLQLVSIYEDSTDPVIGNKRIINQTTNRFPMDNDVISFNWKNTTTDTTYIVTGTLVSFSASGTDLHEAYINITSFSKISGSSGSTLTFKNYSSWSDLITDLKSLFGTGAANILTLYIGDATTSTETTLYGTSTNLTSGTITGSALTYSLFRGMGSVGYKLSSFMSGVFEFFASYFDTGNNLITDALMINTFGVGSISIYRTISSCLTSNSGELTFYTGKFSYDLDSLPMPLSLRVEYLQ